MKPKPKDKPIPAVELKALRDLLTKKGVHPGEINVALGAAPDGKNRKAVADGLIAWLRTRKKG